MHMHAKYGSTQERMSMNNRKTEHFRYLQRHTAVWVSCFPLNRWLFQVILYNPGAMLFIQEVSHGTLCPIYIDEGVGVKK